MQFTFLSAHKVLGIVHRSDAPDLLVYEGTDPKLTVSITSDVNEHWRVLDRQVALASMMLCGMVGQPLSGDFHNSLAQQIETVRKHRSESLGGDAVLVIAIHGEKDVSLKDPIREIDDYLICFDAFDKSALRASLQPIVSAVLTALRIGASGGYEFENVGNSSYLVMNDGRIVHSFSAEFGSPNAYVSSPLKDEQVTQIAADLRLILGSGDLERVVRLHAHSLDRATDNFRAFISAWSALEILLGKVFPIYHKKLSSELAKISEAPGLRAYLGRIDEVMNDKHNLTDKFAVVSMFLDDEGNEREIEVFRGLKKVRHRLSHGDEVPEETLPTKEVQRLFEKYFRNHVRKSA